MNIGSKIKEARINARLTQDQTADALGVTRQTVSNWENEKTYPDIISVIKMSDLYSISLDHLLKGKEEKSSIDYLDYLEESTNVVKSRNKLSKLALILSYLLIWAFSLIVFWFFSDLDDAMGYSVMFLWIVLPITTFVISLLIGKNNYWGKYKWFSAIIFGVMYMFSHYATFSVSNMLSSDKINIPEFAMSLTGTIISAIGLGIGTTINRKTQNK